MILGMKINSKNNISYNACNTVCHLKDIDQVVPGRDHWWTRTQGTSAESHPGESLKRNTTDLDY